MAAAAAATAGQTIIELAEMNRIAEESPVTNQPGTSEATEAPPTPPAGPSSRNEAAAASQAPLDPVNRTTEAGYQGNQSATPVVGMFQRFKQVFR
jgi:hypothetical protein